MLFRSDGAQMSGLADAARCRSESDWLIGINGTRALTKRMFGSRAGNVASVGRVQTPTLAIVYNRELEIRNFKPRGYWRLTASGAPRLSDDVVIKKPGNKIEAGSARTRVEIDFGTSPVWEKTFTITDAAVTALSNVSVNASSKTATGRVGNDALWDGLFLATTPAAGSFELSALAVPGPVVGRRVVQYQIG